MRNDFSIVLSSDLDFEGMVVEINFKNIPIAQLDYEKGINNIQIDLFSECESPEELKFNLDDFLDAIDRANKLAIRCAKEDEEKNRFRK